MKTHASFSSGGGPLFHDRDDAFCRTSCGCGCITLYSYLECFFEAMCDRCITKNNFRCHVSKMMNQDETTVFETGSDALLTFLENDQFRSRLISKLNENVDIPFVNESTEEVVLQALYSVILETLKDSLKK